VDDAPTLSAENLPGGSWGTYGSLRGLLKAYAPVLKFHEEEQYGPIDVDIFLEEATLLPPSEDPPYVPPPDFGMAEVTRTDLARYSWAGTTIDLPCEGPDGCVRKYQELILHHPDPFVVYATARVLRSNRTWIVLQYWFLYYFNDWRANWSLDGSAARPAAFDHEGDWEHISVALDYSLSPRGVAYGQHEGFEIVDWANVEKQGGTHPVVYVALGSHASYPHAGVNHIRRDDHRGTGRTFVPHEAGLTGIAYSLEVLPRWTNLLERGPGGQWVQFSGYWGKSDILAPKVLGPAFHDTWVWPGGGFQQLVFQGASPVELIVTDPLGRTTWPDSVGIPRTKYAVIEAGDPDHRVVRVYVFDPIPGDYEVQVVALPDAPEGATYSLSVMRQSVDAPPDTVPPAVEEPVPEQPERYVTRPELPVLGQLSFEPEEWLLSWTETDSAAMEVKIQLAQEQPASVDDLLWETLRLNGSVSPLHPPTVEGDLLAVRFPRGPALRTLGEVEAGSYYRVEVTGIFADSLRLLAEVFVRVGYAIPDEEPFGLTVWPSPLGADEALKIGLRLRASGSLVVEILDASGRRVRQLLHGTWGPGTVVLEWDARNGSGEPVPSGIYFLRVQHGGKERSMKVALLK
jgi:hypothetical protein